MRDGGQRERLRRAASPRAQSAPTAPASTSPAPAVASCGTAVSTTRSGSPGAATSVSGPFSSTAAPRALGRLADARQARVRDRRAVAPEQAPELAGVRGQRRRPGALAQRLEPPGEREQRIGIEHERRLHAAHERIDELGRAGRAPEARPGDDGAGASRELEHALGARARRAPSAPGACAATAACSLSGTHTQTTPAPARSAASAASAGAPLMPGDPPTTSTPPASYFEPVGERPGTSARSAGSMRRARGGPASAPGRPIGSSITSPAWPRPGSIAVPSVRPWNASVSAAWIAAPSTRPLAPSTPLGTSSATIGAASAVGARDERLGRALEPAAEAAAEERVDDHVGILGRALGHAERRRGRAHRAGILASCSRPPQRRTRRRATPATCRWRATTKPSPPLLPGPHSTLTATPSP